MGAFCGPSDGAPAVGIETGSSSRRIGFVWAHFEASAAAIASDSLLPCRTASMMAFARPLLKEQFGSTTRHSASFMLHPQEQPCSRKIFKAVAFCAAVRLVR